MNIVLDAFITKSQFSVEDISIVREALFNMDLIIKYPDNSILSGASEIALEHGLTIYDSLYITVAKSCNAVFYTEDIVLDINKDDKLIGIEILNASRRINLENLFPLKYKISKKTALS